jgi:hypothetical protein
MQYLEGLRREEIRKYQKKKSGITKKLPEILGNITKYYEIPGNIGPKT